MVGFCVGQRQGRSKPSCECGCLVDHLLNQGDQRAHRSTLEAHDHELPPEEEGGVGLATISADLQGLSRQLFGKVGISGDLRSLGKVECIGPAQNRLIELLGQGTHDLDTTIHLVDVPCQEYGCCSGVRHQKEQYRIADALGPNQGVRRPGQLLLEHGRHQQWIEGR